MSATPDIKTEPNRSDRMVFVFPARTLLLEGKKLFFLFTARQVVTILEQPHSAPFENSSPWIQGTANWRGKDVPVLSLENCLGLPLYNDNSTQRIIALREVYRDDDDKLQDLYILCAVSAAMRRLMLPLECRPIAVPQWISQPSLFRGMYEMDQSVFMVIHLQRTVEALTALEEKHSLRN